MSVIGFDTGFVIWVVCFVSDLALDPSQMVWDVQFFIGFDILTIVKCLIGPWTLHKWFGMYMIFVSDLSWIRHT